MQNATIVETHGLSKRFGSGVLAVDGVVVAAGLLRLRDVT